MQEEFYRLLLIGKGCHGKVYMVNLNNSYLALKQFKDEFCYEKEDSAYRLLNQDNSLLRRVIPFNSYSRYIFFELAERRSLFFYVRNLRSLSEEVAKYLLSGLLDAMEAIENAKMVHGNIHLENILLTKNFQPKLIGFGESSRTARFPFSCESIESEDSENVSDLKDLACTLFNIVIGSRPWRSFSSTDKVFMDFLNNPSSFWRSLDRHTTDEFKSLIHHIIGEKADIRSVRQHPWMQGHTPNLLEIENAFLDAWVPLILPPRSNHHCQSFETEWTDLAGWRIKALCSKIPIVFLKGLLGEVGAEIEFDSKGHIRSKFQDIALHMVVLVHVVEEHVLFDFGLVKGEFSDFAQIFDVLSHYFNNIN